MTGFQRSILRRYAASGKTRELEAVADTLQSISNLGRARLSGGKKAAIERTLRMQAGPDGGKAIILDGDDENDGDEPKVKVFRDWLFSEIERQRET